MPKRSHEFLQNWYKNFAKELYEKANIDITRIEDIGRVKNFYFSSWDNEDPLEPRGDYRYAYIPHDGMTYDNPPPSIENADEYMDWVMDNLQIPTTDDQIEKLMEMSMAGTLMIFMPNMDGRRQVHTDRVGRITTSPILEEMDAKGRDNVPEDMKLPLPPKRIEPADPTKYGLQGCPAKPVRPKNMNPGFLSWLGYLIGIDTDYAKKKRYEEEVETYDKRFQKWFDGLDDRDENVSDYKLHRLAREEYLDQIDRYKQDPLGIATAIFNGYSAQQADRFFSGEEEIGNDGLYPTIRLARKEEEVMKNQHASLPQGEILAKINRFNEFLSWEKRSKHAMTELLGHQATPDDLKEYLVEGVEVFVRGSYKPEKYALPVLPKEGHTDEERIAFDDMMKDVAEVASFAALAHPDVIGTKLREGFDQKDSARLNYSMILQNVMTGARPNGNEYMAYLEPGRQKGRSAMEAYARGELEPLAELLRISIRQTNREAAGLQKFDTDHSLNTLYYISRMYKLMQNDPKLAEAVGLTQEELDETKGNVALHKTMTKGLEAKKLLLEYALYKRNLTPEQLREAATDIRFASSIAKDVSDSHKAQDDTIYNSELYQEGLREMEECSKVSQKEERVKALRKEGKNDLAAQLQAEIDKNPGMILHSNNLLILAEFERKPFENSKNLADEEWVKSAKAAIAKNCNIDRVTTMKREDLAALISYQSDTAFDKAFKAVQPNDNVRELEAPAPVRDNNAPVIN